MPVECNEVGYRSGVSCWWQQQHNIGSREVVLVALLAEKKLPNQLALAVTGRCIGTLENVCAEVCQPRLGLFRSIFKAWLQIADFDFEARAAGQRTQLNERIWRTTVGGVILKGREPRRFNADGVVLLDTFVSWVYENGEIPPALLPTISIPTASRMYFRSRSGGHGL
jgi:hypothetical protein